MEISQGALDLVDELEKAITTAEEKLETVRNNIEDHDTKELGEMLELLRGLISRLDMMDSDLTMLLAKRVPLDALIPLGTGNIMEGTQTAPSKKWNHKVLSHIVSEKILENAIDPDTGAITVPTSILITRVFDYVQPSYWRVGKLGELGIDSRKYYEKGESRPKINIIKSGIARRAWKDDND